MSEQPNIVFIFADQHRHDALGCAGNDLIDTPNLDRLAGRGVRFSNAWCQSPICQPSRAALITGRYPSDVGVLRNFGPDMDDAWPTFMKQLQQAGYATANVGKTHYYAKGLVAPDGETDMRDSSHRVAAFGFDHVVEEFDRYVHAMDGVTTPYTEYLAGEGVLERYVDQIKSIWRLTPHHWDGVTSPLDKEQDLTSFLTREAQSWLDARSPEQPFFLQLSYVQPHVPLMGDPEWAHHYQNVQIPRGPAKAAFAPPTVWADYLSGCEHHANAHLLTDDYVLAGARQYYAMISLIDECVGNLVSQLERQGVLDNTLIVYSSDHGEMLGDHGLMAKFNFYRSSVQVPLIVCPPGGRAPRTCDDLVELIDVGPTLIEAASAEPLPQARGRSLVPMLAGGSTGRDYAVSEIQQQGRGDDLPVFRAIRDRRYRFTLETTTGTPCELFDLDSDPDELANLISDPASSARVDTFTEQLTAAVTG